METVHWVKEKTVFIKGEHGTWVKDEQQFISVGTQIIVSNASESIKVF